ncbi:MAG: putative DNA binding domain-containing protein [Ignavibacteria bacterium]|nr:putative DNA binding domain-containing protein [Ignavibacteria bacterium]
MYLVELYKIIEDGENSNVEFKRKFSEPEKIAKEMIAFANSKGGIILFGVDDNRDIIGVESEKGELELIDTAAKFYCEPEVGYHYEIMEIKNKDIVIVTVPESKFKPHKLISEKISEDLRVYIRSKDKSVIASKETVNLLKHTNPESKPLMISYGKPEKQILEYLKENERITVNEFKKLANISRRRASRTIVNLVRAGVIIHNRQDDFEFYTLA